MNKNYRGLIIIIVCAIILLVIAAIPFAYHNFSWGEKTQMDAWGAYGGFVGGILAAISTIYLVWTFQHQRNETQKEDIEKRFLSMLEHYKSISSELQIKVTVNAPNGQKHNEVIVGKKVIDHIVMDAESVFQIVRRFRAHYKNYTVSQQSIDLELTYLVLYFGYNSYSLSNYTDEIGLMEFAAADVLGFSVEIQNQFLESDDELKRFAYFLYTNPIQDAEVNLVMDGYHNQLGHYFRHIYNMVSYINDQKLIDANTKYELLKMWRSQLTNNEQKLIFLNSFFKYGTTWEKDFREWTQRKTTLAKDKQNKLLITNYRLIKNIPMGKVFDSVMAKDFYPDIDFESSK